MKSTCKASVVILMIIIMMASITMPAHADELNYNLYQLSATSEKQVANDTMKVTLIASHHAQQSVEATKIVNQQVAAALKVLKRSSGIHYETGNYQTHPVYKNQQITGWKASQQIELQSTDVDQLTELVGKLQQNVKVSTMRFEVSKQVQQTTEDALSAEALQQFKSRAELIQKTMGANRYQVVSININAGTQIPPIQRNRMRAEMAVMSADAPAPSVESGSSTVNVTASGQIQLIFD